MAVLVLAIGGLALARSPGTEPVEGDSGLSGFRQQVTVDQDIYDAGQPVEVTNRICWSRPWPTWAVGEPSTIPVWNGDDVVTAHEEAEVLARVP